MEEEEEGWEEGGRVSGEASVASSGGGGAGGDGAGGAGDGNAAPHSGQNRPGAEISRWQDGQTGIGDGG